MDRLKRFSAGICFLALLLCGCGQAGAPDTVSENALAVKKEGGVSEYLVSDFDRDYYDISELEKMAAREAAEYNEKHARGDVVPVTAQKVEHLPGDKSKVMVQYDYNSADTFQDFNGKVLFFGTVSQAKELLNEIEPGERLYAVRQEGSISMQELLKMQDKHIIITEVPTLLYCPYAAAYVSEGLSVREDGSVDASKMAGTMAVIIMKK